MDNDNSDADDFELASTRMRRRSIRYGSTASQLNAIIREARRTVSNSQNSSQFVTELGNRFPFASPSQSVNVGARRASSSCNRVPTRGPLSVLCKKGLGTLWFCSEDRLEIATYLNAQEVHYIVITLYPPLKNISYNFCKATGPGNNVLVPLNKASNNVSERGIQRQSSAVHTPLFAADQLKSQIGRKGRLYIRPCQDIDTSVIPDLPEHEAYAPKSEIPCLECGAPLQISEIADHLYVCENRVASASQLSSGQITPSIVGTGGQGPLGGAGVVIDSTLVQSNAQAGVLVGIGGDGDVEGGPGVVVRTPQPSEEEDEVELPWSHSQPLQSSEGEVANLVVSAGQSGGELLEEVVVESTAPDLMDQDQDTAYSPILISDVEDHVENVRQQQDAAFNETLRTDQRRDWQQALQTHLTVNSTAQSVVNERELEEHQLRMEQWYQSIRVDLREMLPLEPPEGVAGNICVRVRLPSGDRVMRRFQSSERLETLFNFVGSQECINPRRFRILLTDTTHPREVHRHSNQTMREAGLTSFTLVIAENREESGDSQPVISSVSGMSELSGEETQMDETHNESTKAGSTTVLKTPQDLVNVASKVRLEYASNRRIHRINVNRVNILNNFLDSYTSYPELTSNEIRVEFDGERGLDGGGLVREAYALFWEAFEKEYLEGREEKVPLCLPRNVTYFFHVGRILSHGYVLTGYFPLCFCKPLVRMLVSGNHCEISDEDMISSFLKYIDAFEEQAIKECLEGNVDPTDSDIITSMLARFKYHSKPSKAKLRSALVILSRFVLIYQPFFAVSEIRRGMLDAHPQLWASCTSSLGESLVYHLRPTSQRVWNMFVQPDFKSALEETIFDYLRRLIHSLSEENLAKLMRFITGNPQCGLQSISVTFNCESNVIKRRPTTNTCGMILNLPVTYTSFTMFSEEFKHILDNSDLWQFDFL